MKLNRIFPLLKETFKAWQADKASRLGAALAYYTIFSIGPLILVIIAIVGFVLGKSAADGKLVGAIAGVVGAQGAQVIQDAVKNAAKPGAGIIASVIGVVTLLMGASGIFGQLQDALNTVWNVTPPKGTFIQSLISRIPPFLMVVGSGVLLLVSMAVHSVLSVLGKSIGSNIPGGSLLLEGINLLVSLGVITILFAMIFKFLPDTEIQWPDVWLGAAITSVLFALGQLGLAFYLSLTNVGSPYGVAGSLVTVLVWIYYSAQLLLFGAEFTKVYARKHGSHKERAVKENRGVPRTSPWFA